MSSSTLRACVLRTCRAKRAEVKLRILRTYFGSTERVQPEISNKRGLKGGPENWICRQRVKTPILPDLNLHCFIKEVFELIESALLLLILAVWITGFEFKSDFRHVSRPRAPGFFN